MATNSSHAARKSRPDVSKYVSSKVFDGVQEVRDPKSAAKLESAVKKAKARLLARKKQVAAE